jgi:hypothetical protein
MQGWMYYIKDESDFKVAKHDLPAGYTYADSDWSTINLPLQQQ